MLEKMLKISCSSKNKTIHKFSIQNNEYINEGLSKILNLKNGFFCFEEALHFYSYEESVKINNLIQSLISDIHIRDSVFFAQDIFCNQFCIKEGSIYLFDIESLDYEYIGKTFGEWENCILKDYNYFTGYELAHEWQVKNGRFKENERLNTKIPFILGGEYSLENLFPLNYLDILKLKLNIAKQIIDCPDGQQIQIKIEN